MPPEKSPLLWAVLRHLAPATAMRLLRAWWAHHDPAEVATMEHACRELQKTRDMGHAAALDLVRWVEGTERRVSSTVTTTQPFPALRPEPDSKPSAEPSPSPSPHHPNPSTLA